MTKARTLADNFAADINGITAGTGITGGGTSGTVTITNEMATTITAKGDLLAGTGNAAFDNLAAGASGETLVADSSTSTGLRYQAPYSQQPVLNSAFQIWQRGTSLSTASATYTADRWYAQAATNGTVSRQLTSDTTNLPNIQYCARVQRTAAATTITDYALQQPLETVNSIPFAGKTVTLSFYARKGANFSATSSILNVGLYSGTGTDQLLASYTGLASPILSTATLTTTWQRFTYTGTVGATATELAINFYSASTGTAGAADYYEITGVQLEVGSVATPFKTYAGTLAGELAACLRYFFRNLNSIIATGSNNGTNGRLFMAPLTVPMRTTPTMTKAGTVAVFDGGLSNYQSNPGFSNIYYGTNGSTVKFDVSLSSAPSNNTPLFVLTGQTSSDFIDFSAEL